MVTTTAKPSDAQSAVQYNANWYLQEFKRYAATFLAILAMYVSITAYQYTFAETTGLDSTDPLFETYWMNLFYLEVVFQLILAAGLGYYFWKYRDRNLDQLSPREELRRYLNLTMWISLYTFSVYWAGSFLPSRTTPGIRPPSAITCLPRTTSSSSIFASRSTQSWEFHRGFMRARNCRYLPRASPCR